MKPKDLPVYQQKEKIISILENNQIIVVESPTGSGKTTQIPLILHEAGYGYDKTIGVTQPRRIAAVSVSDYIARQIGSTIPGTVGYKMRFEDKTDLSTRIKIMTDGILLQELKADRLLSKYSVIMVDEAHERSLNIDFILGLLKNIIEVRPDFKVIVSSATINSEVFSHYFGGCPIVHIETQIYPVQIIYDQPDQSGREEALYDKILSIITRIMDEKRQGDILVFLSGEKPIKDTLALLQSSPLNKKLYLLPLYGRLSKEEQERVFEPSPQGKTKIVIATNIAETSVTIDGITTVIDSGLAKINYYNPKTFTSSLVEGFISKASCNQRKGRAGRTQPGTCYRLYGKRDFDTREMYTIEEIYRTDLSEVILRMAELGIRDYESFSFISPPNRQGIIGAIETLKLLDALDDDLELTPVGRMMIEFPLLPRLSRIIVEAVKRFPDVLEEAVISAAFLSAHSPFILPPGEEIEARSAHHSFSDPAGDFVSYLNLYRLYSKQFSREKQEHFCERWYLDMRTMNEIMNIKAQLEEIVSSLGIPITSGGSTRNYLCAVSRGLIQFVCVRSGKGVYRSLTAEKIHIHPGSVMFRESPGYIVAGEIVRTSRMFARSVSPLNRQWLREISEELHENLSKGEAGVKKGDRGKRSGKAVRLEETRKGAVPEKAAPRDTTWRITLGGESFDLIPYKGKKKIAVLPWEKISRVVNESGGYSLRIHENVRAKIIYKGFEIHSGDRLAGIIKIVPYIDPEPDLRNELSPGGALNTADKLPELCRELEKILRLGRTKKKSEILGFFMLQTDGVGNYWLKTSKSFHTAVDVSLSSLELLADELSTSTDKQYLEAVSSVYRKLSAIYEK